MRKRTKEELEYLRLTQEQVDEIDRQEDETLCEIYADEERQEMLEHSWVFNQEDF